MSRSIYISHYSILFFHTLLVSTASALPSGSGSIWQINIDNNPAPSPEDGPALSANAIRDPAYLPIQIGGIVGSYLVWIIFVSIAVLTVGRKLRRQAQTPKPHRMEIIHPNTALVPVHQRQADIKEIATAGVWEVTPISPTKDVPWSLKSWTSMKKHTRSQAGSVVTFNDSVISEDRAKNEIEMDRLYAAVAEHDAQRSLPASPPMPSMPMSPLNQNPPEFQQHRYGRHNDSGLLPSPPMEHEEWQSPTLPPTPHSTSKRNNKPAPLNFSNGPSRNSSRSSLSSFASFGGKKKGSSSRGLPISPPMGSPDLAPDGSYLDTEPLSPRLYKPGPPPPTPPVRYTSQQAPLASPLASPPPATDEDGRRYFFSHGIRSSRASMSTSGPTPSQTPRTATFPIYPPPSLQEEQAAYAHHLGGNNAISITLDASSAAPTPRAVPNTPLPYTQGHNTAVPLPASPSPYQTVSPPTNYSVPRISSIQVPPRTGSTDTTLSAPPRRGQKPAPLTLTLTGAGTGSGNASTHTLPLRTAPLPLRALRSPNSTRPMSTIKNTELTRPDPSQGKNRGLLGVPGTAGMVPPTPYSPYMPMTPLTPMTPSRLVTREERKKAKKEEGRRVLTQDDMVVDEGELWGEGY